MYGHRKTRWCDSEIQISETLFFQSVGRLNFLYAYRPSELVDESANPVVMPGPKPNNLGTPVDINALRAAYAHAQEGALRKAATKMGVMLEIKLHGCNGCLLAKGIDSLEDTQPNREDCNDVRGRESNSVRSVIKSRDKSKSNGRGS